MLEYAGLQSLVVRIQAQYVNNDTGSPLYNNIRAGDWLMDYIINRLEGLPELEACLSYIRTLFGRIRLLPRSLKPKFVCELIVTIYDKAVERILGLMTGVGQT